MQRRQRTEIRTGRRDDDEQDMSPKARERRAFKTGNRKQRRMIAKRNRFFKDKSGTAWRESNRMIREDDPEVRL